MKRLYLLIIFFSLLLPACSSLEGEFAFRKNYDETYYRPVVPLEFSVNDDVKWVYRFKKTRRVPSTKVGIILMKRELVWVDIFTSSQDVSRSDPFVYGTIPRLSSGEYKILLTDLKDQNRLIDEITFLIYEDESSTLRF